MEYLYENRRTALHRARAHQNAARPCRSLKKVADIGYRYVQVSGTCNYEPAWLKEQLEKNGLCCVLTHTKPEKMLADPQKVAEEHSVFGCNYIGLAVCRGFGTLRKNRTRNL